MGQLTFFESASKEITSELSKCRIDKQILLLQSFNKWQLGPWFASLIHGVQETSSPFFSVRADGCIPLYCGEV